VTGQLGSGGMFSSGGAARRRVHFGWAGSALLLGVAACEDPDPIDRIGATSPDGAPTRQAELRDGLRPIGDKGVSTCLHAYEDETRAVLVRFRLDGNGHPLTATAQPGNVFAWWDRDYADGDLVGIVVRSTSGHRTGWTYADGRVASDDGRSYEWREDGLLARVWDIDGAWTPTWDAEGRLVAEEYDWYSFGATRTEWGWDGERLLGWVASHGIEPFHRVEWDAWEGNLPTHGVVTLYEGTGAEIRWEERWEWEDGRPILHTSTRWGREEIVGAWRWDGERLLESASRDSRAVWTWDDAGHVVAIDREGNSWTSSTTYSWDGDALVERLDSDELVGWRRRSFVGDCPPDLWSPWAPAGDRWTGDGEPFPAIASRLPRQEEPWW
jgi:hypothetical protein